jgi:hypothetical protein
LLLGALLLLYGLDNLVVARRPGRRALQALASVDVAFALGAGALALIDPTTRANGHRSPPCADGNRCFEPHTGRSPSALATCPSRRIARIASSAMRILCTSSAPSASRAHRAALSIPASGVSSE